MMHSIDHGNSETVWKLVLSYDGTDFHGWQVQPGKPTIQGALADAIASVTGEQVLPQGSGRTDAGVHAWGQVASFSLHAAIPAENFQRALNRILPTAIRILSAEHAAEGFHARHSAVGKVYQYRIYRGLMCSPFMTRYVSICRWPLDLEAMQSAADMFVGEHDFTSFAASDPDRAARLEDEDACNAQDHSSGAETLTARHCSNIRRIETSQWFRESLFPLPGAIGTILLGPQADSSGESAASDDQEIFTYTVAGSGFLHNMVRNLVGTLLEVGRGRMAASDMTRILESRNRALAGPTAAARGLCLMKVLY
ncbi:MAG TPA: tRNA pseudouridine synthase A [Acidobacteriaceae bacterium]|nr:tRNA pseudouridine synthase A [Acidobacteriaceae bacterium]